MKTARIMITGVNGFVGHHLVNELKNRGAEIIGVAHTEPDPELEAKLTQFVSCDLTKPEEVSKLNLQNVDAVIHLAALASQAMSFEQPQLFISANSAMVINVFEHILAQKMESNPRLVMISSGAIYESRQEMPLTEASKVTHSSPYAISKLLSEDLCEYYRSRGVDSIVVRPFNHTGPGQLPGYLIPDLTKQLIDLGPKGTLRVGNLQTRRDYSDARDIVKIYADLAMAPKIKNHLYNACSGKSRSGQEVLNLIVKSLYGADADIKVEVDSTRIRPNDPPEIFGSAERLHEDIGWEPTISLEQTIEDYVTWAKNQ